MTRREKIQYLASLIKPVEQFETFQETQHRLMRALAQKGEENKYSPIIIHKAVRLIRSSYVKPFPRRSSFEERWQDNHQ